MAFICVGIHTVVNVPDDKASARERGVKARQLPILDEEIFLAICTILPQAMSLELGFDVC